ncbi:MAG: IS66 family transposase [Bacteroidaceae bacterium]|nr:IS66 family transposase [Bacteroidaceae bacterium]
MKQIGTTALLREQLRVANATIEQLNLTIRDLRQTVEDLRKRLQEKDGKLEEVLESVKTLESALCIGEEELKKQKKVNKGLSHLIGNKSEKIKAEETGKVQPEKAKEDPKLRGNNNARRNMRTQMEVVEHDVYPDDDTDFDLSKAREIRVRDSIRYEFVPAKFLKHVYHLHYYEKDGKIVSGSLPMAPLQNSSFDGSFIAGIMELRYLYSMSVERITAYFNAHGFEITKATANGLLVKSAGTLEKLHECLRHTVLTDSYLGLDETYMKVMLPEAGKSGKHIRKGYIWTAIARTLGLVYYFYEDGTRSGDVIEKMLKGYSGTIQSDGYKPYRIIGKDCTNNILRIPCLQHIKRKFLDAEGEADADLMTGIINEFYSNEHRHKIGEDGWTEEENLRWRQKYAPPILRKAQQELKRILRRTDVDPDGFLIHAAKYMNNEMDAIWDIFSNGTYELDNNLVERYNRYISLSRRNSLFFGSHVGAERGAILYSLACSCRMQGINFFNYISDVLNKRLTIPDGADWKAYRNLLPDAWKAQNVP